jgi:hypothetical protein
VSECDSVKNNGNNNQPENSIHLAHSRTPLRALNSYYQTYAYLCHTAYYQTPAWTHILSVDMCALITPPARYTNRMLFTYYWENIGVPVSTKGE